MELEKRIWGQSIASARRNGVISTQEADFLLEKYLAEFKDNANVQDFGTLFGAD